MPSLSPLCGFGTLQLKGEADNHTCPIGRRKCAGGLYSDAFAGTTKVPPVKCSALPDHTGSQEVTPFVGTARAENQSEGDAHIPDGLNDDQSTQLECEAPIFGASDLCVIDAHVLAQWCCPQWRDSFFAACVLEDTLLQSLNVDAKLNAKSSSNELADLISIPFPDGVIDNELFAKVNDGELRSSYIPSSSNLDILEPDQTRGTMSCSTSIALVNTDIINSEAID